MSVSNCQGIVEQYLSIFGPGICVQLCELWVGVAIGLPSHQAAWILQSLKNLIIAILVTGFSSPDFVSQLCRKVGGKPGWISEDVISTKLKGIWWPSG